MFAFSAEISAFTTDFTCPPAKKCASISFLFSFKPALVAAIKLVTITEGGTFLHRIRTNCNKEILTPDTSAVNHNPTGIK